jgi:DNA invertase Pin-like site-specific DNA recombinase
VKSRSVSIFRRLNSYSKQHGLYHALKAFGQILKSIFILRVIDEPVIMERLADAKAGFRSLTEAIDTTTPAGRMMMQMVGAFAEFERAMLKERTKAGLDATREDGRIGGRRPKLSPQQQVEIRKIVSKGDKTAADAARLFKIHPTTVSRLLARTLPSARKAKHAK